MPVRSGAASGSYDVVVVGAGMAGLTAAAYLSRGGARVLVCEQAAQVGGLFNSFWRNRFLFDGGIKAVESSAVLLPMLADLDLLEHVGLERSPIALIAGGEVRPMGGLGDVGRYWRWLTTTYPAQQDGLEAIWRDVRAVFRLLDGALAFPIPLFLRADEGKRARTAWMAQHRDALGGLPRSVALLRTPFRAYLSRQLHDATLVSLLAGLFPEGTTAFFALAYFRIYQDYYYPRGGMHALPNALADAITIWEGEIRLRTRVEQIVVRKGVACAVRTADGDEIAAGQVIAAGDLRSTLLRLVPEGDVPGHTRHRVQAARVSHTAFNLHLGLDVPPDELPFDGYSHLFYLPDGAGISASDRLTREDYFAHVPLELSAPCLRDPSLAPPGKSGLTVSCMTDWRYDGGWDQTGPAYEALKERAARDLLDSLGRLVPRLKERVEYSLASTPRTLAEVTANTEGAIMGWSYERGAGLNRGSLLQIRKSVRTPVSRLLVAGHWAWSPGGSPVAILTGRLAAQQALQTRDAER